MVAGKAFGCGSSREEAPRALKGTGVKAVIARSFAFIYSRNQPNLALLGIVLTDESFYRDLDEGAGITIDLARKIVVREDTGAHFTFQLSSIEEALISGGGVGEVYKKSGAQLFRLVLDTKRHRVTPFGPQRAGPQEQMAW